MPRYVPKLPPLDPCPVERVVDVIGGRWKARILFRLAWGSASVGDLRRHLPRARPQVLLAQLGAMQEHGVIERLDPVPGESWGRYALTEGGRKLCFALRPAAEWGTENIGGWTPPAFVADTASRRVRRPDPA